MTGTRCAASLSEHPVAAHATGEVLGGIIEQLAISILELASTRDLVEAVEADSDIRQAIYPLGRLAHNLAAGQVAQVSDVVVREVATRPGPREEKAIWLPT